MKSLIDRIVAGLDRMEGEEHQGELFIRWLLHRTAKELRREMNKPENRSGRAGAFDTGYDTGVNAVIRTLYREGRDG